MFSGKFNCDENGEITYIYEFGELFILFIYYINERRKESLILISQTKQTLRNGNERKRYMLERTSHKIKLKGKYYEIY